MSAGTGIPSLRPKEKRFRVEFTCPDLALGLRLHGEFPDGVSKPFPRRNRAGVSCPLAIKWYGVVTDIRGPQARREALRNEAFSA